MPPAPVDQVVRSSRELLRAEIELRMLRCIAEDASEELADQRREPQRRHGLEDEQITAEECLTALRIVERSGQQLDGCHGFNRVRTGRYVGDVVRAPPVAVICCFGTSFSGSMNGLRSTMASTRP